MRRMAWQSFLYWVANTYRSLSAWHAGRSMATRDRANAIDDHADDLGRRR